MSKTPRILPLVGIAIGGVIAANVLSGAHAIPQMLSATRAAAEEAITPKGKRGAPHPAEDQAPPPTAAPAPAATPIPPICAPSASELAKQAGLSPAELQILQSLQSRRGQIDEREKDLDTEVQLLAAAEAKLDAKLKSMNDLKADIQALMGQADVKTQAEVDRLVVVYSKMKPQDAAAVMAQLDDRVRLPIAASMKPAVLSAILGKMSAMEAKDLTEKLAHRFAPVQAMAQAANAPISAPPSSAPPSSATPAGKSAAKSKPRAAPAATSTDDQLSDEEIANTPHAQASAAKAAPPKAKRLARAASKKPRPKATKPAASAQAKAETGVAPPKPVPYSAVKDKAVGAAPGAAALSTKSS
jgi:flagellar motility protein MotE (MotC chaperone)